jgi:hypothetical protein
MPVDFESKSLLFPDELPGISDNSGISIFCRWSAKWFAVWKPARDRNG